MKPLATQLNIIEHKNDVYKESAFPWESTAILILSKKHKILTYLYILKTMIQTKSVF